MAKQVQIMIICDRCKNKWRDDDDQAPTEVNWSWNGTDYLIELCGDCKIAVRELVQPLIASSEQKKRKQGRPVGSGTASKRPGPQPPRGFLDKYRDDDGMYACPYKSPTTQEPCGQKFGQPQHLGNHHARGHGIYLD